MNENKDIYLYPFIPSEQRVIMNISLGVTEIRPDNIYLISDNNFRPFNFLL